MSAEKVRRRTPAEFQALINAQRQQAATAWRDRFHETKERLDKCSKELSWLMLEVERHREAVGDMATDADLRLYREVLGL